MKRVMTLCVLVLTLTMALCPQHWQRILGVRLLQPRYVTLLLSAAARTAQN